MAQPVFSCTCEANLAQLRIEWNTQTNPDLRNIEKQLKKIRQDHLCHTPYEQFQFQYSALSARLKAEQASSPDFAAGVVKSSRGARILGSSSSPAPSQVQAVNTSASPAPKPQFKRQDTQAVPSSQSRHGFQRPEKTPSPPQPSDSSKKSEGTDQ